MIVSLNRNSRTTVRVLAGVALGVLPVQQLFTNSGWIVDVWLTMAIVILPAVALRTRYRPAAWHLFPGMVLGALFLTARFVPYHAFLGIFPTLATASDIATLSDQVRTAMSDQAAPVHATSALRFYLAAGLALTAALSDLVAVCLRSPAVTGIGFLTAVTVCGAVSRSAVSVLWIVPATIGFLLVLSSETGSDLSHWGRLAPDATSTSALRRRAGESGRRIGAISLVLALLLASLVPMPSHNVLADLLHHDGPVGNGKGTIGVFLDPLAGLRGQLTRSTPVNLFQVNVSGAAGSAPFYLRQEVLESYTGSAWVPSNNRATPRPIRAGGFAGSPAVFPDNSAQDKFTATIHIQQVRGAPPLFYLPSNLAAIQRDWQWDSSTELVSGTINGAQTYSETVVQPKPSTSQLIASESAVLPDVQRDLQLPAIPAEVTTLVSQLTATATTPYTRALAIFNFFADSANNFSYSLTTKPGDSGSDLVDFLKNRVGYCQQYAAAMGVMLRLARVPARLVLGYTHPAPDRNGNFQVTTSDAHAWVEAYFSHIGWVPFDPTPLTGSDASRAAALPWAARAQSTTSTGIAQSGGPTGVASTSKLDAGNQGRTGASSSSSNAITSWAPIALIMIAVVVIALLAPAMIRWLRRRRRLATRDPLALWTELQDTCTDLRIGWSPARTPRQLVAWLREFGLDDNGTTCLRELTDSVELVSYGPTGGAEVIAEDLADGLQVVRRQLIASARRTDRVRAWAWPASLWNRGWIGQRTGLSSTRT